MTLLLKIRTWIFYFLASFVSILMGILLSPSLISVKLTRKSTDIWLKVIFLLLKLICNLDYKVIGKENIPKPPFIVVSKHQSVLETFALSVVFSHSIFILKKSIIHLPVIGLYLRKLGMIYVNREKGREAIQFIQKQLKRLSQESVLVIFPEGTRTKAGQITDKYKSGIAMIEETLNWPILPVALNSGLFWPKTGAIRSGTATIKILPTLQIKQYNRKQFLKSLNEVIEKNSLEMA